MKLEGRRESTNVDDRRGGSSMGTIGGLGIGGLIIIGLLTWLLGGDPSSVIQEAGQVIGTGSQTAGEYTPTAEEEELARFSKQILAGTEDVWTKIFRQNGLTYEPPKLVLFSGQAEVPFRTMCLSSAVASSKAVQSARVRTKSVCLRMRAVDQD